MVVVLWPIAIDESVSWAAVAGGTSGMRGRGGGELVAAAMAARRGRRLEEEEGEVAMEEKEE